MKSRGHMRANQDKIWSLWHPALALGTSTVDAESVQLLKKLIRILVIHFLFAYNGDS